MQQSVSQSVSLRHSKTSNWKSELWQTHVLSHSEKEEELEETRPQASMKKGAYTVSRW